MPLPPPDTTPPPVIREDSEFQPRRAPTAITLNTPDDVNFAARKAVFESGEEYSGGYHLNQIGAAAAYARGATGAGEKLLIVDVGIRASHQEFSGTDKLTHLDFDPKDPYIAPLATRNIYHGTYVASIAAARRDQEGLHGVAFNARIYLSPLRHLSGGLRRDGEGSVRLNIKNLAAQQSLPETTVITAPGYGFRDAVGQIPFLVNQTNRIVALANSIGSPVVNISFGISGYASSRFSVESIKREFRPLAEALAQSKTPDKDKVILVYSAGNERGSTYIDTGEALIFDSPSVFKSLALPFPELRSHILVVVAVNEDGTIWKRSNHCGIAKDFCLAAPGGKIRVASSVADDAYHRASGTSYAAPMVSGALLVLREHFRGQLGNHELVARLLATASREGIHADSYIYGHGLLDLDAATRPVGAVMLALPSVNAPLDGSALEVPLAYGNAVLSAFRKIELVGFDNLNHPFWFGMSGLINAYHQVPKLSSWLSDQPVAEQSTLLPGLSWFGHQTSDLRLAGSRNTLAFSSGFGLSPQQSLYGFRGGLIAEQDSHQQTRGYGAFGSDIQSNMAFLSYEKRWSKGPWSLGGHLLLAIGDADYQTSGIFQTSDSVYSSAKWTLDYQGRSQHTQFKIEQPLRAEAGEGSISYAYQRTLSGDYLYRQQNFSLVPDARELHFNVHYEKYLRFGELALEFNHNLNAGHSSGKQETWLSAGYRWRW